MAGQLLGGYNHGDPNAASVATGESSNFGPSKINRYEEGGSGAIAEPKSNPIDAVTAFVGKASSKIGAAIGKVGSAIGDGFSDMRGPQPAIPTPKQRDSIAVERAFHPKPDIPNADGTIPWFMPN